MARALSKREKASNRCDVCGRFIRWTDIEAGEATRYLRTPDSDRTREEWVTRCAEHPETLTIPENR